MKVFMDRRALPEYEQDEAQELAVRVAAELPAITAQVIDTATLTARYPEHADLIVRAGLRIELTEKDVLNAARNAENMARSADNREDDERADGDLSEDDDPEATA